MLISRAIGNKNAEATALNNIGLVYLELGELNKASRFYNQALPLARLVGSRVLEGTILNNTGGVYSILGEKQKELELLDQALSLHRAVGDNERSELMH